MCVSAEASFALTGLLVPVGIYCVKMASQRDRRSLPLAAVPFLFGIQQLFEGLVWIGVGRANATLTHLAALVYLFFALPFWLLWIPLSAIFLEPRKKIKMLLGLCAVLGLAGSLAFYLPLLLNPEALEVNVVHHSLQYEFGHFSALESISLRAWNFFYLAVVALPLLLASQKRKSLIFLCTSLIVSAAISHAYFWYAFASVWCFLAAVLSLMLGYVFHQLPLSTKGSLEPKTA